MCKRLSIQGLDEPKSTRVRAQRRRGDRDMSIPTIARASDLRDSEKAVGANRTPLARSPLSRSPLQDHPRAGAASWVLVLLAALMVAGLATFAFMSSSELDASTTEPAPDSSESSAAPTPGGPSQRTSESVIHRRSLAESGRVRGTLSLPRGVQPPAEWELVLEPSLFHQRGEAEERRLLFTGAELEFDVQGLNFGGYDVRPIAEGMNALAVPLELSPEAAEVVVNLVLTPAGSLRGTLQYADGSPVEGVLVRVDRTLERASDLIVSRSTFTGVAGNFSFDYLPDGAYELRYGDEFNPILRPERLMVVAPSLHLPPRTLVGLGELTVEVFDAAGNPVPDVAIFGSGKQGGTIDHFTGPDGRCRVLGLPAGHYRIRTEHPGFPSQGEVFQLEASQRFAVRITLVE